MKIKNAVICAAGLGSRLGLDTPKCLVKLGKHRLIYYLLDILKDVENVRIVVGFKEEEVIAYVKNIREDVVFVRNPDYSTTSNSYSLYLGSHDLDEPFISIDGDMIIDHDNFKNFVDAIDVNEDLIAVTKAKTEDAVFAKVNETNFITEFSRKPISKYEWSGVAYFANFKVSKNGKYVYQEIEPNLPVKAVEMECWEIDTPGDLDLVMNEVSHIF
ncbi:nucleotidyltransferase [Brumimicrobium salinarum]|uniref:Nucleotidyltransferase n=1 Tax=Brumimicrobium salinarum TaxID=2058658 RepID=A0A2I0R541_9FLAO|nr:NTP transferase domain-containing protein [Brumimicrobium salinarum]PKR81712.1 nucleotidyltransferase [Brumimicrobium salinarum]